MSDSRPISAVGMARYRRAAGIPLSDDERRLLREYERKYDKTKLALYVPLGKREEWQEHAHKQGQSVSEWARDRVAEAVNQRLELQRLAELIREANEGREEARKDAVRQAQEAEKLRLQLQEKERDYAYLLRHVEMPKP